MYPAFAYKPSKLCGKNGRKTNDLSSNEIKLSMGPTDQKFAVTLTSDSLIGANGQATTLGWLCLEALS